MLENVNSGALFKTTAKSPSLAAQAAPGGVGTQLPVDSTDNNKSEDTAQENGDAGYSVLANHQRIPDYLNEERYPTIVLLNQQWTEIRCSICGANARNSPYTFFRGIHGLHNHIVAAHHPKMPLDDAMELFTRRILNAQDVDRIGNGQSPLVKITKVYSEFHGTKRPRHLPGAPGWSLADASSPRGEVSAAGWSQPAAYERDVEDEEDMTSSRLGSRKRPWVV